MGSGWQPVWIGSRGLSSGAPLGVHGPYSAAKQAYPVRSGPFEEINRTTRVGKVISSTCAGIQ